MYTDAMQSIHVNLIQKGPNRGLTHTVELIPSRRSDGQMYAFFLRLLLKEPHHTINSSWQLSPKQDHLVCFLGGSLMLGATTTESIVSSVSTPPLASELTEAGQKDWKLGAELIDTCMDTHQTAT
jgi:endoplasmic reticulum Man9GlcNAc2 1,2-alpha-mannosidase